jgi:hypothetical protein
MPAVGEGSALSMDRRNSHVCRGACIHRAFSWAGRTNSGCPSALYT